MAFYQRIPKNPIPQLVAPSPLLPCLFFSFKKSFPSLFQVPLTECQRLIAANGGRFCTFHPGAEKAKPELSPEELANIRCLFAQRHLVTFGKLRDALEAEEDGSEFKELLEKVQNFAHFAGPAAKEMALIL
jgi:hypothetical protein